MDATAGTWSRAVSAVWRRTARGTVVLTPGRDDVVLLDGTAEQLWRALDRPTSARALAGALADLYGVPPEEVLHDLVPSLLQLRSAGVVEHREDAP